MKTLMILSLSLMATVASANQTLVCTSSDFNPSNADGQSLKVTLDNNNKLLAVEKVEGSWFCDSGKVVAPEILAKNAKVTVYDVNFKCDEIYGRVIVPAGKVTSVKYEFGYTTDDVNGKYSDKLDCK